MNIFTKHALEKMDALGIDKEEVGRIIKEGTKWREEQSEKLHAQMAGTEVVFAMQNQDFIIITVYQARREK